MKDEQTIQKPCCLVYFDIDNLLCEVGLIQANPKTAHNQGSSTCILKSPVINKSSDDIITDSK